MNKDYRKNQKVIGTLLLEDKGQDFLELDILENGVILGNSILFLKGRLSLLGIGTLDGKKYCTFDDIRKSSIKEDFSGLYVYLRETNKKEPLPWKAKTLNYKITGIKKAEKPDRFIKN